MRFPTHFSVAILVAALNVPLMNSAMLGSSLHAAEAVERPLLTITGKITPAEGKTEFSFDRAALEALGVESIETTTPWHTGKVKFEGVSMAKLMQKVGATGKMAVAIALDDYVSNIPIEDFTSYHVILALKRDGKDMAISDKGPLFVIYPYDSDPELRSQKYYSRSAWQVKRIDIR